MFMLCILESIYYLVLENVFLQICLCEAMYLSHGHPQGEPLRKRVEFFPKGKYFLNTGADPHSFIKRSSIFSDPIS